MSVGKDVNLETLPSNCQNCMEVFYSSQAMQLESTLVSAGFDFKLPIGPVEDFVMYINTRMQEIHKDHA